MPKSDAGSVYSVPDSEDESADFAPSSSPPPKRRRISAPSNNRKSSSKTKSSSQSAGVGDIEDAGAFVPRPHARSHHDTGLITEHQQALLDWFDSVRDKRGMPWRKRYDPALSIEEKGQRAYEIWVSEVMLQQTQVNTVIAYWKRWIERWPTIADLAGADIEEVNSQWRGLGYYRRARSLLSGAQGVMKHKEWKGRLPEDPAVLEKGVDGVGKYTAGAITSMAYGVRTPIVDGNVHRLLTRLLAIHAPQTGPPTIKALWQAAEELVRGLPDKEGVAGDWNQALMELGSTVCKPVAPDCIACPLRPSCKAYAELSAPPPTPEMDDECGLCVAVPVDRAAAQIPSVTVFPMRKEKKTSRAEHEVVCVLEATLAEDRRWLFVKRPDKGLLAGLFEPPTTPVSSDSTADERYEVALVSLSTILDVPSDTLTAAAKRKDIGSIPHIFSHIDMTYHIVHVRLDLPALPSLTTIGTERSAVWLDEAGVEHANVGTGVKKVWAEVYGAWGSFEAGGKKTARAKKSQTAKGAKAAPPELVSGKIVKKIMMPMMPARKV